MMKRRVRQWALTIPFVKNALENTTTRRAIAHLIAVYLAVVTNLVKKIVMTITEVYEKHVGSNMEMEYLPTPKENIIAAMEEYAAIKVKELSTHPPVVEGGLRWVKASERLPEMNDSIIWRFIGKSGIVSAGFKYSIGFFSPTGTLHNNYDQIEWLEEIPTQVTDDKPFNKSAAARKFERLIPGAFGLPEHPATDTEPSTGMRREEFKKEMWKAYDTGEIVATNREVDNYASPTEFFNQWFDKNYPLSPEPPTPVLPEVKEGEIPEEIMEWVNTQSLLFYEVPESSVPSNFASGAIAMYRKIMEEMPGTENPLASYWFEKSRQLLVDRNDFKAQLSSANARIRELEAKLSDYCQALKEYGSTEMSSIAEAVLKKYNQ